MALPPPAAFCGTLHTSSAFTAAWSPYADAVGYIVNWRKVGEVAFNEITGITTTSVLIDGLLANTLYEFKVAALVAVSSNLSNDGGVLMLLDPTGWAASDPGTPGLPWSNGGVVSVSPGAIYDSGSPPLFFGAVTSADLLMLNLGVNLPTSSPASGTLQLWNHGSEVWVA